MVVGVIENTKGEILIARRQAGQHLAGLWEFPGGKVEAEEKDEVALKRELNEELGINVRSASHLFDIDHEYPEKTGEQSDKTALFQSDNYGSFSVPY